jgi:hypothetical protein
MDALRTKRNTIAAIALLVLGKIYLSAILQLNLDEAYYGLWSRHLDLGYSDHPPFVAYFREQLNNLSSGSKKSHFIPSGRYPNKTLLHLLSPPNAIV